MTQLSIPQAIELAQSHYRGGDLATAESLYRKVLAVDPSHAEATHSLGLIAHQMGNHAMAIELIARSIALAPDVAWYYNNYGEALRAMLRGKDAVIAYRKAIELDSSNASAWNNLAITQFLMGQADAAIESWQRAIALLPGDCRFHDNLGTALQEQGRLDEAIACHERAIQLNPDFPTAYSNLLLALKYHESTESSALLDAHRRFARRLADPLLQAVSPHTNDPNPDRPLRIGYVSPDLREHSVAYFLEPILRQHDRSRYVAWCYSTLSIADQVTERLRSYSRLFRSLVGLSDQAAADQIRADGIDILVDLAGHTGGNRALVLARKPAPIQVSYLGYASSMGMAAIDYRFTDALADPPGMTERLHTETLIRLPRTFLCFQPFAAAPAVSSPPADASGRITFGSFNNFAKVTPGVIALWSRILQAVPDSRVVLKSRALSSPGVVRRVLEAFASRGIAADRIAMVGQKAATAEHLALYAYIDIALDTFPFNGTTTTCEALWMGVPVVTLAGDAHITRVGLSLLTAVGLPDLITTTHDDYLQTVVALAADRARRAVLRSTLRAKTASSPLLDASGFTASLEEAYRGLWQTWCARR